MSDKVLGSVMVVGGGIAGMQASLDLANAGYFVHLVEKGPAIGGTMAQIDKTFPTNDCAMWIISPKLVEVGRHTNIQLLTLTELKDVTGESGHLTATLEKKARYVDENKCTGCGTCLEVCPIRYEVQLPGEAARARTAYAAVTDEDVVAGIINTYRDEPGNLLPVMLDINRHFNWLPRPALEHISDELKIPLTEILRVASFYNAFSLTPRGKNIINACLGTGCFVKGSPRLLERLERKLGIKHGGTTEDMAFTLEVVRCIGCYALAPAIRVGEATYGRVNPDQVSKIIDSYIETAAL